MAEDHYLRLRAAIVRDLKPDDVLDWINAYDHLNKLWEEQRYRRAGLALISVAQGGRILSRRYLAPPSTRNTP